MRERRGPCPRCEHQRPESGQKNNAKCAHLSTKHTAGSCLNAHRWHYISSARDQHRGTTRDTFVAMRSHSHSIGTVRSDAKCRITTAEHAGRDGSAMVGKLQGLSGFQSLVHYTKTAELLSVYKILLLCRAARVTHAFARCPSTSNIKPAPSLK